MGPLLAPVTLSTHPCSEAHNFFLAKGVRFLTKQSFVIIELNPPTLFRRSKGLNSSHNTQQQSQHDMRNTKSHYYM